MLAKEIEKEKIPTALVTTIESTARMMKASRIVIGGGITHPMGNPELSPSEEKRVRKVLVEKALRALETEVKTSTTFT